MGVDELLTKKDLAEFERRLVVAIQSSSSGSWPARMKKKTAAQYMNTSPTQIDEYVREGRLTPHHDKDPGIHPNTPTYFNKEDLDKIRLGIK